MEIEELKDKLKSYKKKDIIITDHAKIRTLFRKIDLDEVKENILNPERLTAFREQKAEKLNEKSTSAILLIRRIIVINMF